MSDGVGAYSGTTCGYSGGSPYDYTGNSPNPNPSISYNAWGNGAPPALAEGEAF